MTLTVATMPLALTAQVLDFGANLRWLNRPVADKQGRFAYVITGAVRVTARLVYQIAVALICSPLGILYHGAAGVIYKIGSYVKASKDVKAQRASIAWEHFKASFYDMCGFGAAHMFFVEPSRAAFELVSGSTVFIEEPTKLIDAESKAHDEEICKVTSKCLDHMRGDGIDEFLSPNWPYHQYTFGVQRQYRMDQLFLARSFIRNQNRHYVPLESRANLRMMHTFSFMKGARFEKIPTDAAVVNTLHELDVKAVDESTIKYGSFKKVWALTALTIAGVVAGIFLNVALLVFLKSFHIYIVALPFLAAALGFNKIRREYINVCGESEVNHALSSAGEHTEFWYRKAVFRGYAPALRAYGNFLFDLGRRREGLDLIHAAAGNGSPEALEDLRKKLKLLDDPLPPHHLLGAANPSDELAIAMLENP